jgi:uncharacterized protein (DUF1697 family)
LQFFSEGWAAGKGTAGIRGYNYFWINTNNAVLMIYVALLRGINVGGNNKVDMKQLKMTFERIGMKKVVTYINSGNIIFEDTGRPKEAIPGLIEEAILTDFELAIHVLIRDFEEIDAMNRQIPATWVKDETMRTDVMFLWQKYDSPAVVEKFTSKSVDNLIYMQGAVVWNVDGRNYSQSGMLKIVGSDLYRHLTIRNVNTFRKIHEIMAGLEGTNPTG